MALLLDSSLNLDAQVSAVARSAFVQLKLVHQLNPFLVRSDLASVTHTLVTSWLDYCKALYVGLPMESVRKLQQVQNAARLLTGAGYRDHITCYSSSTGCQSVTKDNLKCWY